MTRRLFGIVYFVEGTTDELALQTLDAMTRDLSPEDRQHIEFIYAVYAEDGDLPAVEALEKGDTDNGRRTTTTEGDSRPADETHA